ncbi:molybdopterin molybdotransferase MoeA [Demequina mangrovi]|uniref:Molybdopterin molybdenumtransferase n=1 Tax=Demequina mangrovi TaxID=1043493 RepID=A0A1H6VA15_9MICO|nr:gephyrin-like molybdotransferase Glp [Demequina mangrovi]SEI97105.1 molybdopterin molybdochelatase [Demequina mangrovi]
MRSAAEHLAQVLALVEPPEPRRVPLADALDAVLAVEVRAATDLPPFDNSAMDGYAVRAADAAEAREGAPVRLAVVGESAAGHPWPGTLAAGEAVRIMTGAPMPSGADAVVPQERVVVDRGAVAGDAAAGSVVAGDAAAGSAVAGSAVAGGAAAGDAAAGDSAAGDAVLLPAPAALSAHVRRRGEDAQHGDLVVPPGVRLRPRHLAAAAAAGVGEVVVVPAPRVAFLVTGDELVAPGGTLAPGQIFESNAVYLEAALRALGAVPVDLGAVGDSPDAVLAAVSGADADLVVTTGGASVGEHDPVKAGLAPAGVSFLTVAIQPGKPQGLGRIGGVPVVCLPGNPVAVAVCVEVFVAPAVRAMRGVAEPPWTPMRALEAWRCPPGREQVMPVTIDSEGVRPATSGGSGSHLAARLASADGLARVRAEADAVAAGDIVAVRRFTV